MKGANGGKVSRRFVSRFRTSTVTGGSSGSASGTLYWVDGTKTHILDVASGKETEVQQLSNDSQGQLGYGGGLFTDVESTSISPEYITVNLRDVAPNPYTLRSKFGPFPLHGSVMGPVRPSPDGKLFTMRTRESTGELGAPDFDYVYVFDAALNIVFKLRDYYNPVWLGSDRLVVTSGRNLYTITVSNSPVVARIGADGLVAQGELGMPSVSPDGKSIAFVQFNGVEEAVWRINVDGSGLTQLTKFSVHGMRWPSWSLDGSRLIVQLQCIRGQYIGVPIGPDFHINGMVIISATTTNQDRDAIKNITTGCGPVYWLP